MSSKENRKSKPGGPDTGAEANIISRPSDAAWNSLYLSKVLVIAPTLGTRSKLKQVGTTRSTRANTAH